VCTFAGPLGIFVQALSKQYILYFQDTAQLRQFYFPGWCGAQKTSACISGTSHKNVRYVPDRPVTIIKVRRYGALFLTDNSLQNRKNDAFFPLRSIPENIFQKMYRSFS
jgi:hypothetical protein